MQKQCSKYLHKTKVENGHSTLGDMEQSEHWMMFLQGYHWRQIYLVVPTTEWVLCRTCFFVKFTKHEKGTQIWLQTKNPLSNPLYFQNGRLLLNGVLVSHNLQILGHHKNLLILLLLFWHYYFIILLEIKVAESHDIYTQKKYADFHL